MKELTKKELKLALFRERITYSILIISCLIMMIGMTCNYKVIQANEGKMPVKLDFFYEDSEHFSFQNESEIGYPQYADIYYLPNRIYSIGDLIMLFALGVVLIYACYITPRTIKFIINAYSKKNGKKK